MTLATMIILYLFRRVGTFMLISPILSRISRNTRPPSKIISLQFLRYSNLLGAVQVSCDHISAPPRPPPHPPMINLRYYILGYNGVCQGYFEVWIHWGISRESPFHDRLYVNKYKVCRVFMYSVYRRFSRIQYM